MFEVKKDHRTVNRETVTTYRREITNANILEVEAGTTGLCGGDTGHGCRTYIRIENLGGTDMNVEPITGSYNSVEGVVITLGGDAELLTITEALEFVVRVLKEEANID